MISVSGFGEILNEFLSYNRLYEICLSLIYQLYSTFDFFLLMSLTISVKTF